jgi:hypothetical protein
LNKSITANRDGLTYFECFVRQLASGQISSVGQIQLLAISKNGSFRLKKSVSTDILLNLYRTKIHTVMKKLLFFLMLCLTAITSCKQTENYQVYALNYNKGSKVPAKEAIIGANPTDSISWCDMFWLLKSQTGKNILVDAGFIDSIHSNNNYIRPDSLLSKLGISSKDISDIILTHPHYDHIGGITLFPNAHMWIQKQDYEYFISSTRLANGDTTGFDPIDVKNIISVNTQGGLTLIDGDNIEIMPGIKVFTGSKHTFENQYLLVNSNSEKNKILLASELFKSSEITAHNIVQGYFILC